MDDALQFKRRVRSTLTLLVKKLYLIFFAPPSKKNALVISTIWAGRFFSYTLFYFLAVNSNFLFLFGKSPNISIVGRPDLATASEIYSCDSVLLGRFYLEDRSPIEYKEIPSVVKDALLAAEDIRFFKHRGIEVRTPFIMARSFIKGEKRGGSTLTQQLAKNLFKTRYGNSQGLLGFVPGIREVIFKTKEWITALKLESLYSKEEILALYLNTVNFGSNSYGIKIAARTFFSKLPYDLTVNEAALLIGVLKAPTYYSPITNPKNAKRRRNVVLEQMAKYDFIEKKQCDSLCKLPIVLEYAVESPSDGPAPYFRFALSQMLKQWCKERGYNLYTSGLKIYTTVDSRMQKHAENAVAWQMKRLQQIFNDHWAGRSPWTDRRNREIPFYLDTLVMRTPLYEQLKLKYGTDKKAIMREMHRPVRMKLFTWNGEIDTLISPIDSIIYTEKMLHVGFLAMDPKNGNVKAWVGGLDHHFYKYDHVNQAHRQPGSTFKPFVYCTALEKGYSPCDKLLDRPVTITYKEKDIVKHWSPHNSDWTFTGDSMTLRRAMGKSVNTVTAQLTERVTPEAVVEMAKRCGVESPLTPVPSIGLGPDPVTLYEMVSAYSTFANGGFRIEPQVLSSITNAEGKTIVKFSSAKKRVLREEIAYLMTYMFRGSIEEPGGTSGNLWAFDIFKNNELGGKTGTSSSHADGWYIGVTKDLVAGTWVGSEDIRVHFRSSEIGEGSKTALPIFGKFLEKVYADKKIGLHPGKFPKPESKITIQYLCPTVLPRQDTTEVRKAIENQMWF